jgi:ribulose-5-phosphate 4-epimerase/fuculose-1-phosphate aldolase
MTDDVRGRIVAAGARLGARGLVVAAEGNLSVRLPDGRILITRSGRPKDALGPDDLIVVEAEPPAPGREDPGTDSLRPSSDLAVHRAIYAARPDVAAVVHAHPPAGLALTIAGEVPDPAALPETALFLPRLPCVAFAPPGSPELAAAIAATRGDGDPLPGAVLLERHGAIAVGPDLATALDRIELADLLCRVWHDTLLLRAARATLARG